jgi:hypothetical protein
MEKEKIDSHAKLTKEVLESIIDNLEGEFEYTYRHNHHLFSKNSLDECSIHAFKEIQSFHFSIRSRTVDDQEKMLTVLTNLYPFDMTLYKSTINKLSDLYQALSFTVEPLKTKNIEDFSWLSFFKRKKDRLKEPKDGVKNWENFDHFNYEFKLYPWNKSVINLSVTQIIKMIIVKDESRNKYIPVMETSLPLNTSKRTKICISLDKNFPNIYVLEKNGIYEIETLENILNMVNKTVRNYIFNILYQRYKIEISKSDFAEMNADNLLKYVALNEMAEI